jgi:hypothetical protein
VQQDSQGDKLDAQNEIAVPTLRNPLFDVAMDAFD